MIPQLAWRRRHQNALQKSQFSTVDADAKSEFLIVSCRDVIRRCKLRHLLAACGCSHFCAALATIRRSRRWQAAALACRDFYSRADYARARACRACRARSCASERRISSTASRRADELASGRRLDARLSGADKTRTMQCKRLDTPRADWRRVGDRSAASDFLWRERSLVL